MTKIIVYWFISFFAIIIFVEGNQLAKAQLKGETVPSFNPDTVFTFKSPHPLLNDKYITNSFKNGAGFDVILCNNGFAVGGFYQYYFNKNFLLFSSLFISGARNTDEFEDSVDINTGIWYVPGKINRLYMVPMTIGATQYFLTEELGESLKPFVQAGIGPTFIFATPYDKDFFTAFGYGKGYTRFSTFAGVGVSLGGAGKSLMDIYLRYYYIPFGGNGLESIKNLPIKDFGGIFLTLSVGTKF